MEFPFREIVTYITPGYLGFYLFTHIGNAPIWSMLDDVEKTLGGIFFGMVFIYALAAWISEPEYLLLKKLSKKNLPSYALFWFSVPKEKYEEAVRYSSFLWFYILNSFIITLYILLQSIYGSKLVLPLSSVYVMDGICILESIRRFARWKTMIENIM